MGCSSYDFDLWAAILSAALLLVDEFSFPSPFSNKIIMSFLPKSKPPPNTVLLLIS